MDGLAVAMFFGAPTRSLGIKDLLNPGSRQDLETDLLFDLLHDCRRAESERTQEPESGHKRRAPIPIFDLPYGGLLIAGEISQLITGETKEISSLEDQLPNRILQRCCFLFFLGH